MQTCQDYHRHNINQRFTTIFKVSHDTAALLKELSCSTLTIICQQVGSLLADFKYCLINNNYYATYPFCAAESHSQWNPAICWCRNLPYHWCLVMGLLMVLPNVIVLQMEALQFLANLQGSSDLPAALGLQQTLE